MKEMAAVNVGASLSEARTGFIGARRKERHRSKAGPRVDHGFAASSDNPLRGTFAAVWPSDAVAARLRAAGTALDLRAVRKSPTTRADCNTPDRRSDQG